MPGKLPIDRVRARTTPARPYEDHKRTFTQDQADLDGQPDAPGQPSAAPSGDRVKERNEECDDA